MKVSIIITAYNVEKCVERAVLSNTKHLTTMATKKTSGKTTKKGGCK